MTAIEMQVQIYRLVAERVDAVEAGLGGNALYMGELEDVLAASHTAYVGLAVTEIATLRGQLSGPQVG